MSWTDYPALGERCYFLTLPNGLAVRVLLKPGFAEKFAFLGTHFGSDDVCFTGTANAILCRTARRIFSSTACFPAGLRPGGCSFPPRRAGERLSPTTP